MKSSINVDTLEIPNANELKALFENNYPQRFPLGVYEKIFYFVSVNADLEFNIHSSEEWLWNICDTSLEWAKEYEFYGDIDSLEDLEFALNHRGETVLYADNTQGIVYHLNI